MLGGELQVLVAPAWHAPEALQESPTVQALLSKLHDVLSGWYEGTHPPEPLQLFETQQLLSGALGSAQVYGVPAQDLSA